MASFTRHFQVITIDTDENVSDVDVCETLAQARDLARRNPGSLIEEVTARLNAPNGREIGRKIRPVDDSQK
jgi:hypothetical protein